MQNIKPQCGKGSYVKYNFVTKFSITGVDYKGILP